MPAAGCPGDFRCKNRVVAVHSLRSTPATRQSPWRLPPNSTSSASLTHSSWSFSWSTTAKVPAGGVVLPCALLAIEPLPKPAGVS
jgi:hypothetical protein